MGASMGMSNSIAIIVGWRHGEVAALGVEPEDVFDEKYGGFDGDDDDAVVGVVVATGGGYKNFAGNRELPEDLDDKFADARVKVKAQAAGAGLPLPEPRVYLAWSVG